MPQGEDAIPKEAGRKHSGWSNATVGDGSQVEAYPPAGRRMRGRKPPVNKGGGVLPEWDLGGAGSIRLHIAGWGELLMQKVRLCLSGHNKRVA